MVNLAINHMTAASSSFAELLSMAVACGCQGVELRNDLKTPLFDGLDAAVAGKAAARHGIKIHALAEVVAFNQLTDATITQATRLADIASRCGAQGIALIPANDGSDPGPAERRSMLKKALLGLLPLLEKYDLCGFVEPLGFEASTLRLKAEAVEVIDSLNLSARFKLVHDTFHHYLAAETEYFAEYTAMVHVSGVVETSMPGSQLRDSHRVLVDDRDRLQNLQQLQSLSHAGYQGPVSMEVFATEVHALPDLAEHLQDSFNFINSGLAAAVA